MVKIQKRFIQERDIDFENGVICKVLKRIRQSDMVSDSVSPPLIEVWCCTILSTYTKNLINFIKYYISPYEDQSFIHLKRFEKISTLEKFPILRALLCTSSLLKKDELENLIQHFSNEKENLQVLKLFKTEVPRVSPSNKEIAHQWSSTYWPISWKGNPSHQMLKAVDFNIQEERTMIERLLFEAENTDRLYPYVTIIVQPLQHGFEILSIGYDDRKRHPLRHSVMQAIEMIARLEKEKRKTISPIQKEHTSYLCHNLVVYTTHEPCVMCCMALTHSRIERLVYIKDSPISGGLESNYQIGDRDGLNWKFEIWKWIGKKELDELNRISSTVSKEDNA